MALSDAEVRVLDRVLQHLQVLPADRQIFVADVVLKYLQSEGAERKLPIVDRASPPATGPLS